jgi:hypothetical protein
MILHKCLSYLGLIWFKVIPKYHQPFQNDGHLKYLMSNSTKTINLKNNFNIVKVCSFYVVLNDTLFV